MKLAAVICAAVVVGCGGSSGQARPPAPPIVRFQITAAKDTNRGSPLYVVVRKIDNAGFLAEDYDAIADGLFHEPRDPAVVRKAIVRPGEVIVVEAERELKDGELLGVYFLFAVPGDDWRLAIHDPKITRVNIVLGAAGVASVKQLP